jgi:hypothetical protein
MHEGCHKKYVYNFFVLNIWFSKIELDSNQNPKTFGHLSYDANEIIFFFEIEFLPLKYCIYYHSEHNINLANAK